MPWMRRIAEFALQLVNRFAEPPMRSPVAGPRQQLHGPERRSLGTILIFDAMAAALLA